MGIKQVIKKAKFFSIFKSYQKTFFRVSPKAIKEVNVVKTPKKRARETTPLPKTFLSPLKPDSVV